MFPNRIFCIKFHNIIIQIGAKKLVNCVCGITFALSLFFGAGHTIEMALIAPEILANRKHMRPLPNSIKTKFVKAAFFNKIAFLACLLLNVIEFICYMILFYEKSKHQRRHSELCLSKKPEIAKRMRRENTITTAGHFLSWVVEILIFVVIQYVLCNREDTIYIFIFGQLIQSFNYVVFPSVQALSSQELRGHVFCPKFLKDSCLCARRSNNQDNLEADVVELHSIKISSENTSEFQTPNAITSEFWTATDTSNEFMTKSEEINEDGKLFLENPNAPRTSVSAEKCTFVRNCSISAEIALFRPKSNTL